MSLLKATWLPLAAFLLVLLVCVPTLGRGVEGLYPLGGDALTYHTLATKLSRWIGDPAIWPAVFTGGLTGVEKEHLGLTDWVFHQLPTYAFTLGTAYAVFGAEETTGRMVSVVLFAAAAAILAAWTRRRFGLIPAVLAAAVFALWPANVLFGTAIMTELPVTFFLMATLALLAWTRWRGPGWVLVGGLAVGAMAHAKITLLWFSVPLLLADIAFYHARRSGGDLRDSLRFGLIRGCAVVLVVLAWHGFLTAAAVPYNPSKDPGETQLWLYRGSVLSDRGFETLGPGSAVDPVMEEVAAENPEYRKAKGYWAAFKLMVSREPVGWLALVGAKFGWYFRIPAVNGLDVPVWFGWLPPPWRVQLVLVVLAVLGVLRALGSRPATVLWVLPVLWMAGGHAVTHLVTRYAVPGVNLLMPFAAWGLCTVITALTDLRSVPAGAAGWWRGCGPWARAAVPVLVLVLPLWAVWGSAASDRDRDRFAVRLDQSGDAVVQRLEITETRDWSPYSEVEVAIDMLPSLDLDADVALLVNGRTAHRWKGGLTNERESFTLDPRVFQNRHDRLLQDLNQHLAGFVRSRHPEVGLEYYPQWYRVAIPAEWLVNGQIELKLVMEEHRRGHIRVFGDRDAVIDSAGVHLAMPAFPENPYSLSNYQFRMFRIKREWADPRLVRPFDLTSRHLGADWVPAGEEPELTPDHGPVFRMRIRAKYPGQLVLSPREGGESEFRRVVDPGPADIVLTPHQEQIFLRQRAQAATGWMVW